MASKNLRDYTREDMAPAAAALQRWFQQSRLVHGYHVLCSQDKTALRFILPAQCALEVMQVPEDAEIENTPAMKRFERHLGTGLMSVPLDAVGLPAECGPVAEWAKGALVIQWHLVLNRHAQKHVETADGWLRVYPRCEACRKELREPGEGRKVCAGCNIAFYCGPECQKPHWPTHQPFCKFLQAQNQKK